MLIDDETSIESIVENFKARGIDYDVIHKQFYEAYRVSHRRLARWQPSQFKALIVSNVNNKNNKKRFYYYEYVFVLKN